MADFKLYSIEDVVMVTLVNVPNSSEALASVFQKIGEADINLDMISQTAPFKDTISIFFTIDNSDLNKVVSVVGGLKQQFDGLRAEISVDNCKFVLFSELLKTTSGVAARLFSALAENDLQAKLITTSDVEIEVLFDSNVAQAVKTVLESEFC